MRTALIVIAICLILVILTYMKRNKIVSTIFNEKLSENFSLGELLVTKQPFPNIPNEVEKGNLKRLAINVLQPIRNLVGKPVVINSAFRSEQVNKAVGGVDNSQHRLGYAADIHVKGMKPLDLFTLIARSSIPYDQLIVEYGDNNESDLDDWIHVSYSPTKNRRQLLLAKFDPATRKMKYEPITV